jgi:hypothetical protein
MVGLAHKAVIHQVEILAPTFSATQSRLISIISSIENQYNKLMNNIGPMCLVRQD